MLTKSDRKTMAGLGEGGDYAWIWHARSFIPAALADMDAKDALLARVMMKQWQGIYDDQVELIVVCPFCHQTRLKGHAPDCVFAEIAKHLEEVRGEAEASVDG